MCLVSEHAIRGVFGMNSGDTAWVFVCAALVLFMTPGLALFYGGTVRTKHFLTRDPGGAPPDGWHGTGR